MKNNYGFSRTIILIGTLIVVVAGVFVWSLIERNEKISYLAIDKDMVIHKSPSCGCCTLYSEYMRESGFNVSVVATEDISAIRNKLRAPTSLSSCHIATIGNYFIEGHVPLQAVKKLLVEKPDIAGISMPDMPSGSPGMPGKKDSEWTIYAVKRDGSIEEFMRF